MITDRVKETVWMLKETEHLKNTQIADRVGISRGKVIEILKQPKYRNEHLMNTMKEINEENNNKLLKIIKSVRYNDILDDVLSLFTKDNMKIEFSERGMRSLIALQGNMFDKGMALEKLQLDKRKVDISERTLELKEQELQARIDNPEAFATVTIVNDAPKEEKVYA